MGEGQPIVAGLLVTHPPHWPTLRVIHTYWRVFDRVWLPYVVTTDQDGHVRHWTEARFRAAAQIFWRDTETAPLAESPV